MKTTLTRTQKKLRIENNCASKLQYTDLELKR